MTDRILKTPVMSLARSVVLVLASGMVAAPVAAQAGTVTMGTVQGRVHDEEGAAVPGAVVRIESAAGARSVGTGPLGSFRISPLEPGSYDLTVVAL